MSIASNFPALKPTLLLDFANTKELDPRITFTRASTATYFDAFGVLQTAASGVARFDHNPTTFESLGLEIEEQRTNLLTYSEQFDNAAWTKSNTTITANTVVAPDGTLTGDKLVEDTANSQHYVVQLTIPKPSANPTISVYAKAAGRNWIYLNVFPSTPNDFVNDTRAYFDLSTGTVGTVTRGTATIVSVGNGWYRCSLTASQFSSTASANCSSVIHPASANGTVSYTGDGTSGIFIWGAQLEAGAFATSYIPTVASQVTRAADAASMTGTNFSSWWNPSAGSQYVEFSVLHAGSADGRTKGIFGGGARLMYLNGANFFGMTNGTQITQSGVASSAGVFYRGATAYSTSDNVAVFGGNTPVVTASGVGSIPATTAMNIGFDGASTANLNGTIKKFAYYPLRVTNAQLQGLTS